MTDNKINESLLPVVNNDGILEIQEGKTIADFFTENRIDDLIEVIEQRVDLFMADKEIDVNTPDGQAKIKTFAFNIAKTKTALDKAGTDLTSGWRENTKNVNSQRNTVKEKLDILRDKARKPLTDFENAEKLRISTIETRIETIDSLSPNFENLESADFYETQLKKLEELKVFEWDEYKDTAQNSINAVFNSLNTAIVKSQQEQKFKALMAENEALKEKIEDNKQVQNSDFIKRSGLPVSTIITEDKTCPEEDSDLSSADHKKEDVRIVVTITNDENGKSDITIADESINPPKNMLNKAVMIAISSAISDLAKQ